MYNKVTLIGHLGGDPKIRRTQAGMPIANFSMATSERWKDKATGEKRERTEWHRIVIFSEGLTKVAEQYLKKGSKVYIEGMMQTRKWTDQQGIERYSTEVVLKNFDAKLILLDRAERAPPPTQADFGANTAKAPLPSGKEFYNDEIPF
jgi:single-strand DNA-binding protein